jgi:hypothetical protein
MPVFWRKDVGEERIIGSPGSLGSPAANEPGRPLHPLMFGGF